MSEELARLIREEIGRDGPMRFSRWMELCLYHPELGYYMRHRPEGRRITGPGRDADFVTPPTLHPFFARAVAGEIHAAWERAGRPRTYTVMEFGGGEGDMARGAMQELDVRAPELGRNLRWCHREVSGRQREAQARGGDARMRWVGFGEAKADFLLFVEVLDAIPCDAAVVREGLARPLRVALRGPDFVEQLGEPTSAMAATAPEGAVVAGPASDDWFYDSLHAHATGPACALVCDYGGRGPGFVPGVRAFQGQAPVPIVGRDPGAFDITADVDFGATRSAAQAENVFMVDGDSAARFRESSYESLESFLLRHGILEALNSIDRSTVEGASSYLRLRQLLLPTGLGAAFKVQRFDRGGDVPEPPRAAGGSS